jgi:hypothetical protein
MMATRMRSVSGEDRLEEGTGAELEDVIGWGVKVGLVLEWEVEGVLREAESPVRMRDSRAASPRISRTIQAEVGMEFAFILSQRK